MLRTLGQPARFLRNQEGSVVVEFALSVPILFTMILGVFEFMMAYHAEHSLENLGRRLSRFGITGQPGEAVTREEQFGVLLQRFSPQMFDPSKIQVSTTAYGDYASVGAPEEYTDVNGNDTFDAGEPFDDVNNNGTWDEDQGAQGLGQAEEVVVYTLSYEWPVLVPIFSYLFDDGTIPISASIIVKNEPFGVN